MNFAVTLGEFYLQLEERRHGTYRTKLHDNKKTTVCTLNKMELGCFVIVLAYRTKKGSLEVSNI